MTTRKIRDYDNVGIYVCRDRQHNPPGMRVFSPGEYEHTCPSCGNVINFIVRPLYWDVPTKIYKSAKDTIHKYRVRWGI